MEGILKDDYPGNEFYVGGKMVKDMTDSLIKKLEAKGVTLDRNSQRLLATVAQKAFPE